MNKLKKIFILLLSLILVIPVKVIYGISAAISVLLEEILNAIDDTEEWVIKQLDLNKIS